MAGAPEFRGEGTAGTLMKDAMRELHSLDVPLSMLEPITDPLYRCATSSPTAVIVSLFFSPSPAWLHAQNDGF